MNDNRLMRDVVARILTLIRAKTPKLNPSSADIDLRGMMRQIQREYPYLALDCVSRAFDIAHDELIEQYEKRACRQFVIDFASEMFKGLPSGLIIDEAIEIKAKQGHKLALQYLAKMNTKEGRLIGALADAAYAAHPQFVELANGGVRWIGDDDEDPSTTALIKWFQLNHPDQARSSVRSRKNWA